MKIQSVKAGDLFINTYGELLLVSLDVETDLYSLVNINTGNMIIANTDYECLFYAIEYNKTLNKVEKVVWEVK